MLIHPPTQGPVILPPTLPGVFSRPGVPALPVCRPLSAAPSPRSSLWSSPSLALNGTVPFMGNMTWQEFALIVGAAGLVTLAVRGFQIYRERTRPPFGDLRELNRIAREEPAQDEAQRTRRLALLGRAFAGRVRGCIEELEDSLAIELRSLALSQHQWMRCDGLIDLYVSDLCDLREQFQDGLQVLGRREGADYIALFRDRLDRMKDLIDTIENWLRSSEERYFETFQSYNQDLKVLLHEFDILEAPR